MGSSARRTVAKSAGLVESKKASKVTPRKTSPRPFQVKPSDGVEGDASGAQAEREATKKSAVLKSAIAKVRSTVNISLEEQREFRRFLKPHFRTPGEAFDAFADGQPFIDREHFARKAGDLMYSGNAEKVFHWLCDSQGRVSRRAFQQSLKAAAKDAKFGDVVMRAVEVQKAAKKVLVVEPEPSEWLSEGTRARSHSPRGEGGHTPPRPGGSKRQVRRSSR